MEHFAWRSGYLLNIPEVDQQHQTFIYILNQLGNYIDKGFVDSVRTAIIPMFMSYVGQHFAYEEKAMLEVGYPALSHHMEIHRDIAFRAKEIIHTPADPMDQARKLHQLIFTWFVEHLVEKDGEFGRWFAQHPETIRLRKQGK